MHEEVITLDEYVDIEEAIYSFINEKAVNNTSRMIAEHSIKHSLEKLPITRFIYLSWKTMDILNGMCTKYTTINNKLRTHIDIILMRHPIHVEIARYLVINDVPETVYRNLRSYVMANSEEAKAILTMGSL